MILVCVLSILLITSIDCDQSKSNDMWQSWKRAHGKQYADLHTETTRRTIWQRAVDRIREHNLRYDMGLETYRMGVNQFTDLTWEEFKQMYLGVSVESDRPELKGEVHNSQPKTVDMRDIPNSWDWRKNDRVTGVKNQMHCGSCWALSAAGAMEGQMVMANVTMTNLSVQQLIDCSRPFGNNGCSGGFTNNAFMYAIGYGMQTWAEYPYHAMEGLCRYNESEVVFRIGSFYQVKRDDEHDLLGAVYNLGPTSVGVHTVPEFMYYTSGIFHSKTCIPEQLNHGVLVVGFGEENGSKYWLIKNSWSTSWGEDGYMKLGRDMGNMCGVATAASVPLVE